MRFVYDFIYLVLLLVCAPWLVLVSLRTGKYRDGWGAKLLGLAPRRAASDGCIWLHAVSLGEVSLIGSLVEELERRHPACQIAISTTTLTGYELARSRYARHTVFYCPLDFSWAVRRALARLRPSLLVLVELELWPNLVAAARASGVKVAIVNGRLSERSARGYGRIRRWIHPALSRLDLVCVQNTSYADRFLALGARDETVYVTGSLKFDGAQTDRNNPRTRQLCALAGIGPSDVVFLAGSTQAPEEHLAIETFRSLAPSHPALRLVLVPRHPERFEEVARLLEQCGLAWRRRTALDAGAPSEAAEKSRHAARILLVDRVGELAAWWGAAHIAYVGGSMGSRQGQNMIEPAAYGAAVSFGPMTRNFKDVVDALLAADAAVVVRDGEALTAFVRRCLDDPAFAERLGAAAARVVASQLGATRRTADLLDTLLHAVPPAQDRRSAA